MEDQMKHRKKKKSKKARRSKQVYFEDEQEEMEEVIEEGTRRVRWRKRNDKIYNAEVCIAEEDGIVGTIVDSGATVGVIDITEAETLEEDGFVIYKEAKKVEEIVFGKDEYRCAIIGWIYGKGLVDKMAVVETITNSIIPVSMFTDRGIDVTFTSTTVQLVIDHAENIIIGRKSKEDKLWRINLRKIFQTADPTGGNENDRIRRNKINEEKRVMTARHRPRFKAADIRKARELHSNSLHIPYSTIAKMIEDNVWTDLDPAITPA